MYIVILLLVMDLFFYLFVAGSWTTPTKNNLVWNSLQGAHGFAIFLSVVITLLKGPLLYFIYALRKSVMEHK